MEQSEFKELTFNINENIIQQTIEFKPYQSVMIKVSVDGHVEIIDIQFVPRDPIVRPHEKQRMYF
jgi:hypothetical protein